MNCLDCNRDNVIKAYCYFSKHEKEFKEVTGNIFSTDSFAVYAVDAELKWKYNVCCNNNTNLTYYWKVIKPFLEQSISFKK